MNTNPSEQHTPGTGQRSEQGSRNLGRLIMQLRRLERQPHSFGTAGALTPSEIHTIDAIGPNGDLLMSELANRLGITKGAVTQLTAKLEDKLLIQRSPHPTDSRGVLVSLTDKGKEAYLAHEEVHINFYEQLRLQLSEQEIDIFEHCIEKLNSFLER